MTRQDAIKKIRYRIDTATEIAGKGTDGKAFEDLEMAIADMEKQIPKKLDKVKIYDKTYFVCPICKFPLHSRHKFCHCCGQAIDWSEEND